MIKRILQMTYEEYMRDDSYKIIANALSDIGLDEDIICIIQDLIERELKINEENSTNDNHK